ncbi:MAG: glycerol-3-phosphate 1-O-acyltransferase [Spartobacteria bacterium]|nr:glycerol-3-phosphate 1-O-acyltransferase [Spartobacteria bacterium]
MWTDFLTAIILSYVIGSISFAKIFAGIKGVDLAKSGSGNFGATNVFRSVGKGWGIATFVCDLLKGYLPVVVFPYIVYVVTHGAYDDRHTSELALTCGFCAIAGHNWSMFLKFRGGKGVATGAGVLLGVAPYSLGIGLISWIALLLISRYVSVASIGAALAVAISVCWRFFFSQAIPIAVLVVVLLLCVLIIVRHKKNIVRLLKGEENRFHFTAKQRERAQTR